MLVAAYVIVVLLVFGVPVLISLRGERWEP
jgi:cytochrome c oxidase assembly factor CtaG